MSDTNGEDPKTRRKAYLREYRRKYKSTEKYKAYQREYRARKRQDPKWVEDQRRRTREHMRRVAATAEGRKKLTDQHRDWRARKIAEDPEWLERRRVGQRESYRRNHQRRRNGQLAGRYGLSVEDYERLFHEQGDRCGICGRPEPRRKDGRRMRLAIDHNHGTGAVRGLLCSACNAGLGQFRDNVEFLQGAIDYLNRESS